MNEKDRPALAVALHYKGQGAPKVVAKGRGLVADNIIALAKENGIPLEEDTALVAALSQVELGRETPRELYMAVAQVLAFAWQVSKKNL
jgi:flagellar biosynthesis protein